MKKIILLVLLGVSLAANAALLIRRQQFPAAGQTDLGATDTIAKSMARATADKALVALKAALESGDAAQLKAAGLSAETIRNLIFGRAYAKYMARVMALRQSEKDGKYWRRPFSIWSNEMKKQRKEWQDAQKELTQALHAAFGPDVSLLGVPDSRYDFLPAVKGEQLKRIEEDYADLRQQIYQGTDGIWLPADREKLKLLQEDQKQDIAALLTPDEKEQLDLRTSRAAMEVRNNYGDLIQTEDEYRQIYALQKAFDDHYVSDQTLLETGGPLNSKTWQERREAIKNLQDQILAIIGPDQVQAYQKANDPDARTLASLASRLNLPEGTTATVLAARDAYAAQSMQINADTSLSAQERRTQLQALATKAQTELQTTLGADGGAVYAQRATWLSMLKNGRAFSTNRKDASTSGYFNLGTSVYAVPPPRPPARQN